ncbi:hypothetical protein ACFLTH_06825 [Bacteroidota bacterium]
MNISLCKLDKSLKQLLSAYILILSIGVILGILYVRLNTNLTLTGTVERFNGSDIVKSDFDVPEHYPKPLNELLLTTHNHFIGFSFIFLTIGLIFYFNSIITGVFKTILIVEPFVSILLTFGSIWGMRFIDDLFVYLLFISSVLMYLSYFIMAVTSTYELIFKK